VDTTGVRRLAWYPAGKAEREVPGAVLPRLGEQAKLQLGAGAKRRAGRVCPLAEDHPLLFEWEQVRVRLLSWNPIDRCRRNGQLKTLLVTTSPFASRPFPQGRHPLLGQERVSACQANKPHTALPNQLVQSRASSGVSSLIACVVLPSSRQLESSSVSGGSSWTGRGASSHLQERRMLP